MWSPVRSTRRTGKPSSSTAVANGSYWEGTVRVSITVAPSASRTTPALGWPGPGAGSSQAYTPCASGRRVMASLPAVASQDPAPASPATSEPSGPASFVGRSFRLPVLQRGHPLAVGHHLLDPVEALAVALQVVVEEGERDPGRHRAGGLVDPGEVRHDVVAAE